MMTHNQFQKEIQNRNIDPQIAYMLSVVFESQIEVNSQLDDCASLLVKIVETVANFTTLHEATEKKLEQFLRRGRPDGVEVHSVMNDPSDKQ